MDRPFPRREIAVALLLVAAFWPVWRWYGLRLDDGSDEPMGLLALATAAWFLWRDRGNFGVSRGSLLLAAGSLLAYAITFPFLPSMVRALAAIAVVGVAFRFTRVPAGVWGLLLLSLPVLASAQFYAGWPLRLGSAIAATEILQIAGPEVVREGVALLWNGLIIEVDVPCSGLRMLWTGFFFHFALAAERRFPWRTMAWLTPACLLLILMANAVRTVLLFFKESGLVPLPEWTHEGIGVLVFLALIAAFFALHRRVPGGFPVKKGPVASTPRLGREFAALALAGSFAFLVPFVTSAPSRAAAATAVDWPREWEGIDLAPVALTEQESAFAAGFPGAIAVFRTEEGPFSKRLILRRVERTTRKLHSSSDCLRAAGYHLEARADQIAAGDREPWAVWIATGPDGSRFRVRERLHEDTPAGRQWTEVTAWFWSAALGRSRGPWWAVTVVEGESGE